MNNEKRLFIISNRLPVNIKEKDNDTIIKSSSGGLVSAVKSYADYTQDKEGSSFSQIYWVGVPGCSKTAWEKLSRTIQSEYTLLPVFMKSSIYEGYYSGMSNSVIWPLFHYFPTYAEYKPSYFENYMAANEEFVKVLLQNIRPNDIIWIHDYHLLPLAKLIREVMPEITIGFFLHIPFPSFELFKLIPEKWQLAMLEGMLGADLIGFHTIDYAAHFLKSIQMAMGVENDQNLIKYNNRLIKADVFPISIDYKKFNDAYDNPAIAEKRNFYREQFKDIKIIFSVDRLDYTKCIMCRLRGYEQFLINYPQYAGKIVFILSIVPSRDNISNYAKRKREIDEFVGNINGRIGTLTWKPVNYKYESLEFNDMMALYTVCDIALITPLRDGMNLVAKEFVASRKDKQGILLLSEMTGASREFKDAVLINPNDFKGIGDAINMALEMSPQEQEQRMIQMQTRVKDYDVLAWADDFFDQLRKIKKKQQEFEFIFLDYPTKIKLLEVYRKSPKRLLLLDYDGTLVSFNKNPDRVEPPKNVLDALQKLADDDKNDIYVISGRDSETLSKWLGHINIGLVAEHGAKMKKKNGEWNKQTEEVLDETAKETLRKIMKYFVKRTANSFIEEKEYSFVWHYRNSNQDQAKLRASELLTELSGYADILNIQVMQGNKIIEARVKGMNKGAITKKLLLDNNYGFILACGDDNTDEDMFKVLQKNKNAFTIKIGDSSSYARYNIFTPQMCVSLLEYLGTS